MLGMRAGEEMSEVVVEEERRRTRSGKQMVFRGGYCGVSSPLRPGSLPRWNVNRFIKGALGATRPLSINSCIYFPFYFHIPIYIRL